MDKLEVFKEKVKNSSDSALLDSFRIYASQKDSSATEYEAFKITRDEILSRMKKEEV